jgi:hypothetical protein
VPIRCGNARTDGCMLHASWYSLGSVEQYCNIRVGAGVCLYLSGRYGAAVLWAGFTCGEASETVQWNVCQLVLSVGGY